MEGRKKRNVRTYKIADDVYEKALARGREDKSPLATLLENVAKAYAEGRHIYVTNATFGKQRIN
jgi:hypothetical protein